MGGGVDPYLTQNCYTQSIAKFKHIIVNIELNTGPFTLLKLPLHQNNKSHLTKINKNWFDTCFMQKLFEL